MRDEAQLPDFDGSAFQNIVAEQALLGAVLLNNDCAEMIQQELKPDHFRDPVHGRVWRLSLRLIAKATLASPITLRSFMDADEGLRALGGPEYLVRLAEFACPASSVRDHAALIIECWRRRRVVDLAKDMMERAGDAATPAADLVNQVEGDLGEVGEQIGASRMLVAMKDVATEAAQSAVEAIDTGGMPGMSTGLDQLDELMGGWVNGRLYLLGGVTSMGKTAFGIHAAFRAVQEVQEGDTVLYSTLEMLPREIAIRVAAQRLTGRRVPVTYAELSRGRVDTTVVREALREFQAMADLGLCFTDTHVREIDRIVAAIRHASRRAQRASGKLRLAVIDYLHLIKVPGAKSRVEETLMAATRLQEVALWEDIPILCLAQVKQDVSKRDDPRPELYDVDWSKEVSDKADGVLYVHRPGYFAEREWRRIDDAEGEEKRAAHEYWMRVRNDLEIIVRKNRHGAIGTAHATIDMRSNIITSKPVETSPAEQGGFF